MFNAAITKLPFWTTLYMSAHMNIMHRRILWLVDVYGGLTAAFSTHSTYM